MTLRYLGVDGVWLRACVTRTKRLPSLPMTPFEKKHLELLRALPVDWADVVGEEALGLSRAGGGLELEGATSPAFYGDAFARWIERRLFVTRSTRRR